MKIKAKIEGLAPLLQNKFQEEEPSTKKTKKVYVDTEEAEKRVYRNSKGEIIVTSAQLKASLIKAATDFKYAGRKTYKDFLKAGIIFSDTEFKLSTQEYEIHKCSVVIQRARIMRARPMFKDWKVEFEFEIIDENIAPSVVKEIFEAAGKYQGLGDYRPEFGRYKVTEWKVLKE